MKEVHAVMHDTRRLIGAAVLAATLLVATACSGAPAAPAAPAPAPSPAPVALSASEAEFVAQARKIAPSLTGTDERIARRGENTCDALRDGRPAGEVSGQARERFGIDQVSSAQASKLVEAARVTVCE